MQTQVVVIKYFVCLFLALFAVTQLPLYWVEYPDIVDFPNHLARLHILLHLSESEALQQYYSLRHMKIGTNLAMEVIVPFLAKGMSLIMALKIFTSFAIFLLTSGAIVLGRVIIGRFSYLSLGVLLFAQNAMLQLGLLNYLFGLGVAFWLLAAWIYTGNSNRLLLRRIIFSFGCIVVYLCHLSAFGVYAVCLFGYELGSSRLITGETIRTKVEKLLFSLMQFVPVAVLHVMLSVSSGAYATASIDKPLLKIIYIWIKHKLVVLAMLPSICVNSYVIGPSIIAILILCALYIGFRNGLLKLHAPARWMAPMIAISILLLPFSGFGSFFLDIRLIPALGLILWSGLEVTQQKKLNSKVLIGIITAFVVTINLDVANEWMLRDREYKQVRVGLQQIPQGSKVATVFLEKPETGKVKSISAHAGAFSVIDRSAFISNMFAWPFQPFWVAYRENYVSLAEKARLESLIKKSSEYENLKDSYDYVLIFGGNAADRMQYAQTAETVFNSKSLRLIRTGLIHDASINHALKD